MKKRIMNKLRSQAGASITYALLLFLVCAILSSVILSAATTASGRMSGIAESDQRYYAVTSAAELLKKMIEEETVTIVKTTAGKKTETYSTEVSGGGSSNTTTYDYDATSETIKINGEEAGSSFKTITEDAANKSMHGGGSGTFNLSSAIGYSDEKDPLKVSITEVVSKNGDIELTIGDKYKITLLFGASIIGPSVSETLGTSTTTVTSETSYKTETDIIKTETTSYRWTLSGIRINS